MSPHDMFGRKLGVGDLIVGPNLDNSTRAIIGVVEAVNDKTGSVNVRTVSIIRNPRIKFEDYFYPANQLVILDDTILRPEHDEDRVILIHLKAVRTSACV